MEGVEEQAVSFRSHCGKFTLRGTLTRPTGTHLGLSAGATGGPGSVCLLLHGGMAHKDSAYQKHLARSLTADLGYSTFRFDFVGCGETGDGTSMYSTDGNRSGHGNGVPASSTGSGGGSAAVPAVRGQIRAAGVGGGVEDGKTRETAREQSRNMMGGFWDDLEDTRAAIRHLKEALSLRVDCVCGHSRGGQLALMLAARHRQELGLGGVIVVNMRWDLEHWRRDHDRVVAETGRPWVLRWKSRGVPMQHTVTEADLKAYTSVPMGSIASLRGVPVLACYGCIPSSRVGMIDGVVPVKDIEGPVNALKGACTLRFIMGAGHNVRESGAPERLTAVIERWLRETLHKSVSPRL